MTKLVFEARILMLIVAVIMLGYLAPSADALPLSGAKSHLRRSFLRDPMPWEDGYFDPTYHAWPKGQKELGADKKAIK